MSVPGPGADIAEARCPECSASTRTVPNPFYGTGLSVHRYVVQCVRCDWTRLVKDPERGITSLRAEPVEAPASPKWRRLFGHRDR